MVLSGTNLFATARPACISREHLHLSTAPFSAVRSEVVGRAGVGYLLGAPLLCTLALMVDPTEIGHNDRNGKSDHQHATQRTNRAKDLPHDGLRNHVSISVTQKRRESQHRYGSVATVQ